MQSIRRRTAHASTKNQLKGFLCEVEMYRAGLLVNKNHRPYVGDKYHSLPVMSGHYPLIEGYLQVLHGVLTKATHQYRRVFAFRVDLHFPARTSDSYDEFGSAAVSRFIESFKAKIRHNREVALKTSSFVHENKVRYFWVREVGECGRVHYHLVFLLNGDAFNWLGSYRSSGGNMVNRIWEAWASALGETLERAKTLVHFPENPSYMILRGDTESVAAFFHRASYLCKAKTKQYGFGHHGYGASRS